MRLDMDSQIHYLEKEAYFSVLRAFKAQSDAITWDKEALITELRKELRVSDDEHREVLVRVNDDDSIRRIREWRQTGGHQGPMLHPVHDVVPSPTVSASRKKQRTSHSQPLPPLVVPSPGTHHHSLTTPVQPSPSVLSQGRKSKLNSSAVPNGKSQYSYHASSGVVTGQEGAGLGKELMGRKVLTKWPDDNKFYEAVITQFNPLDGRHALVYDMNTPDETWEWVDLKQIPQDDIRWVGEDPGIAQRLVNRDKKSGGPTVPQARNRHKAQFRIDAGNMDSEDIEMLHTETLVEQVEKVIAASNPDRFEIDNAKKMLKEHEEALEYAISKLAYVSDGESGKDMNTPD
ncbi:hypothetical protein V2J09_017874 [Rumex salicifolius]